MPVYDLKQLKEEFVTPQHSSAFGSLITGERIELGKARLTLGAEVFDLGPGQAVHIPSHLRQRQEHRRRRGAQDLRRRA
jgi:hypothetical protein